MEATHSLPTLDISPLRKFGLADLKLKLSDTFVDMVKEECNSVEWKLSKFAHREHGENRGYATDPSKIQSKVDNNTLDSRLIVRQLQSGLNQEFYMAGLGNLGDKKNRITEYLHDEVLKDNSKYFNSVFMLKFTTDQGLIPHKDGGGKSRIYIPIYPFGEDYSRLEFYHNNQIYYVYNYSNPPPIYLFSSNIIHAVFNQGYPERVNLQINSKLSYTETLSLFYEN